MSDQLTHNSTRFPQRNFPLVLVLDHLASPANIGGLFRLSDAFGIAEIRICSLDFNPNSPRMKKTARATMEKTDFVQADNTQEVCRSLIKEGFILLCLEITRDSIPLDHLDYEEFEKVALVVGNERTGIQEEVLKLAHHRVHISMFGSNSSMNVAQSTGIALYEITKSLPSIQEK